MKSEYVKIAPGFISVVDQDKIFNKSNISQLVRETLNFSNSEWRNENDLELIEKLDKGIAEIASTILLMKENSPHLLRETCILRLLTEIICEKGETIITTQDLRNWAPRDDEPESTEE